MFFLREQQWRDALLQWNASEYDNVHQVVLQPKQIWTPDVVLINAYVTNIDTNIAGICGVERGYHRDGPLQAAI